MTMCNGDEMDDVEKEFENDVGHLIADVESVFDDPYLYIEDRVRIIEDSTKKFHTKWGDYTTKKNKASIRKMIGNSDPIVLTKEGPIYFQVSEDGKKIEYGCSCNIGLIVMGEVCYDFNNSPEWNTQEVINRIVEKFGEP